MHAAVVSSPARGCVPMRIRKRALKMKLVSYGLSYRAPSWRLVGRVPLKAPWRAGRSRASSADGRAWTYCSACARTARAKDFVSSGLPLVHGERTKTAPKRAGGHFFTPPSSCWLTHGICSVVVLGHELVRCDSSLLFIAWLRGLARSGADTLGRLYPPVRASTAHCIRHTH